MKFLFDSGCSISYLSLVVVITKDYGMYTAYIYDAPDNGRRHTVAGGCTVCVQ